MLLEQRLCPKCGETKTPYRERRRTCLDCHNVVRRSRYAQIKNNAAYKEKRHAHYISSKDKYSQKIKESNNRYRAENTDKCREMVRESIKKNWDYYRAKGAMYESAKRARVRNATPIWANKFFISEIYRLRDIRTRLTGMDWHVDHIVPLRSPIVCGLHVEHNLRVIPKAENMAKKNKYWPQMPT